MLWSMSNYILKEKLKCQFNYGYLSPAIKVTLSIAFNWYVHCIYYTTQNHAWQICLLPTSWASGPSRCKRYDENRRCQLSHWEITRSEIQWLVWHLWYSTAQPRHRHGAIAFSGPEILKAALYWDILPPPSVPTPLWQRTHWWRTDGWRDRAVENRQ